MLAQYTGFLHFFVEISDLLNSSLYVNLCLFFPFFSVFKDYCIPSYSFDLLLRSPCFACTGTLLQWNGSRLPLFSFLKLLYFTDLFVTFISFTLRFLICYRSQSNFKGDLLKLFFICFSFYFCCRS